MAKYFGIYVGAVKQAVPMRPVDAAYEGCVDQVLVRDVANLNNAAVNDTIQAAILGWETVIDPSASLVSFGALGAASTIDLGDVTFPTALINAAATAAAGSSGLSALTPANHFKPLWAALGYASLAAAQLIGPKCELLFRIRGGAATGAVSWALKGARRV